MVLATKVTGEGQAAVRDGGPITGAVMRGGGGGQSCGACGPSTSTFISYTGRTAAAIHFRQMWNIDPRGTDRAR